MNVSKMATATTSPMRDIYQRLKAIGLPRSFVKAKLLPDWWEDSLAEVPANRAQAEMMLARQLGLTLRALHNPSTPLRLRPRIDAKLKGVSLADRRKLVVAVALASRVAELVAPSARGMPQWNPSGLTASAIRQEILNNGAPWINLDNLLGFCWKAGVPVIFISNFPPNSKKMDGMAAMVDGRPLIVLANGHKQPAWQVFIVAHELGHIVRKHLTEDKPLVVDKEIQRNANETEEVEANDFAVELLTGDPATCFTPVRSWLNAQQLALGSKSLGEKMKIDPGVIALNYSWNQQFFPVALKALNLLQAAGDAQELIRGHYHQLDLGQLTDTNRCFLEGMVGMPDAEP